MTGDASWFSSLTLTKWHEYITFGDDRKERVKAKYMVRVNESFTLKDVALVEHLGYNLLSVSQLLDEDLEVHFKRDTSRVLDSSSALICWIFKAEKVFGADFSKSLSSSCYLIAQPSSELCMWHSKLGHMSFDLLTRLGALGLIRGLSKLKFEKNLVCAPCWHVGMSRWLPLLTHQSIWW